MGYRTIVVGTDGSITATTARDAAIRLAKRLRARLVVVCAWGPPLLTRPMAESLVGYSLEAATRAGVEADAEMATQDPADLLLEVAERRQADLLVVGNKGMGEAKRFRLGSVPDRIAHFAPCDLLIVDTARFQTAQGRSDRVYRAIVAGTDGSPTAAEAARKAFELAMLVRAEVTLVYVGDPIVGAITLEETASGRPDGVTVQTQVTEGDPAEQLIEVAEAQGADLIVVGNKGIAGARRFLLGSVPNKVAHYASTDVLIAKTVDRTVEPLAPQPLGKELDAETGKRGSRRTKGKGTDRFVIVGASLAGGTAAATLRREGFGGSLVLIGAATHLPYERPPLSKSFLRGETAFEDALVEPETFYKENEIEIRRSTSATSLDPARKVVGLAGGEEVHYDRLLVATGARNRRFPIPGIDLEGVLTLRTVEDALRIRSEITPGRRAVLGGMGFIGSEVAASLRQRGVEVTVVDGGAVPLQRVLREQVGAALGEVHRDHGVRIVVLDQVAAFEGGRRVEQVVTAGGQRLDCDFAVLGLGVEPVTDWLSPSGVELDNGVAVDELCRTNVEGVFAAGDVANHLHPVFGRRVRVEHWQNAIKHGRAAALSMLGKGEPYRDVYWFWSDQYDQNLQYAGFTTEWDRLAVRGSLKGRDFVACYLKNGIVQAVVALNRGEDVRLATPLIEGRVPVDAEQLADESRAFRDLASVAARDRSPAS